MSNLHDFRNRRETGSVKLPLHDHLNGAKDQRLLAAAANTGAKRPMNYYWMTDDSNALLA